MKKVRNLVVFILCMLIFSGCHSIENTPAKLPPTRYGEATIHPIFDDKYTFSTAFLEADVVARIKIENWISEDIDLQETYHEATTLQCFKGEIPETFTLLQDGCSVATMKGYPLYTNGNELLVFLKHASIEGYESPFWIIGSFTTILDVSYDEDGNRYYADRYGILGESIDIHVNYALQNDILSEIQITSAKVDPIISDFQYPYVFSEEEMIALIHNQ